MNNASYISNAISFVVYLLLQTIFFKQWLLFDTALCFIYVSFILLLPFNFSITMLMVSSFVLGFAVDIFYDTLGIHAAACVLMAYLRPLLAKRLFDLNEVTQPSLKNQGLQGFSIYIIILITAHHFLLFLYEAYSFHDFWLTLRKIFASIAFTFMMVLIFQRLFYSQRAA